MVATRERFDGLRGAERIGRSRRTIGSTELPAVGQERLGQARRCGAADALGVLGVPFDAVPPQEEDSVARANTRSGPQLATDVGQVNSCIVAPTGSAARIASDVQAAEELAVPDSYFAGADRGRPFSIFEKQSVGPRLFVDAILEDRPLREQDPV